MPKERVKILLKARKSPTHYVKDKKRNFIKHMLRNYKYKTERKEINKDHKERKEKFSYSFFASFVIFVCFFAFNFPKFADRKGDQSLSRDVIFSCSFVSFVALCVSLCLNFLNSLTEKVNNAF